MASQLILFQKRCSALTFYGRFCKSGAEESTVSVLAKPSINIKIQLSLKFLFSILNLSAKGKKIESFLRLNMFLGML